MSKKSKPCCDDATKCPGIEEVLGTKLFKALCEPARIGLLVRQARCCGPSTVGQIAECCEIDLSVVSRHLAILRDAGVLSAEKCGKNVYYSVRYKELASTLRAMADAIEACCPTNESKNKKAKNKEKRNG